MTAGADEETPAARPELTTNPSSFNPESSQFAMTASAFSRIHYGDDHDDEEGMVNSHSEKDPIVGTLYGQSAWEQMSSSWYLYVIYLSLSQDGPTNSRHEQRARGLRLHPRPSSLLFSLREKL